MKISILIIAISLAIAPISIDKKTSKKINKEISKVFKTEEFSIETYACQKTKNINGDFFIIKSKDTLGYSYLGKVLEHTKYFIIFNKDKEIEKIVLHDYQDDYGREMSSSSWLKQFIGYDGKKDLDMGKQVDGISGASYSSEMMIENIKNVSQALNK
jgi:hypothetical protein